jgi:acetyl-CoA/propionyl-CoA carboxylase carboxyl transferase subunit
LAGVPEHERADLEIELAAAHELESGGIDRAVALGVVDEIISPDRTRSAVSNTLAAQVACAGQHGNIPL